MNWKNILKAEYNPKAHTIYEDTRGYKTRMDSEYATTNYLEPLDTAITNADGTPKTLMQAEKEGLRPYGTNNSVKGTKLENITVEEFNNDKSLRNPFLLVKN
jgi:hypothetical protein